MTADTSPSSHAVEIDPAGSALAAVIERLPTPLALLGPARGALAPNAAFRSKYRPELLTSDVIRDVLERPNGGWTDLRASPDCGLAEGRRAQVVEIDGCLVLAVEEPSADELGRELVRLRSQVASLQRSCSTDPLTGVWNRTHFERIISNEMERSIRYRQPVSLLMIDVDLFKVVNDRLGHQAGDATLVELAAVIRSTVRASDMVFRWGGEEFVVLAVSTGHHGAGLLAERVRRAVELHSFADVGSIAVSIGAAEHLAPETSDSWFHRADDAMYRAKADGRNRVWVDRVGSSTGWTDMFGSSAVRLIWREEYECGEPQIDAQHRKLFDLANIVIEAAMLQATRHELFEAAIDRLLDHIVDHFAYEERVLEASRYKDLTTHKTAHASLLRRAGALRAEIAVGQATLGELVDFLVDKVVAQHLFKADKDFFPLFCPRELAAG